MSSDEAIETIPPVDEREHIRRLRVNGFGFYHGRVIMHLQQGWRPSAANGEWGQICQTADRACKYIEKQETSHVD